MKSTWAARGGGADARRDGVDSGGVDGPGAEKDEEEREREGGQGEGVGVEQV